MLNKMRIIMVAFLATAMLLTSCDEDTDDDGGTVTVLPAAPSGMMATSIDSTTIHIKWTASENEMDSNWVGYHLMVSDAAGNQVMMEDITTHTSGDPYPVTDLVAGEVYTMELYGENSDGRSLDPAEIEWSPAIRFTTLEDGVSDISLFERSSSNGSGLDIYFFDTDFDEKGAASKSVQERAEWNLAIDTGTDGMLLNIGSGSQLYTDGGYDMPTETTKITNPIAAESLNDVFDSEGLDNKTYSEQIIDLSNFSTNQVIYVEVDNAANTDTYYAKILLKRGESGWLQGVAPNRYIAAEISYQEMSGVPYARTIKESANTK